MIIDDALRDLPPAILALCERTCARLWHTRSRAMHTPAGSFHVTRLLTGELHLAPAPILFPDSPLGSPVTVAQPDPATWGPRIWKLLEDGEETPEKRAALAMRVAGMLPCGECRNHWLAALREHPPAVETDEQFFEWVWARHNDVNRRTGKPEMTLADALLRRPHPITRKNASAR